MSAEGSFVKLLIGWLTFFVALYIYPAQTFAILLLVCWAVMIWAQITHSGMTRKAAITGWVVGITMCVVLLLLGGGGVCSDGWASPSIGRQGACSWHGGVSAAGAIYGTVVFWSSVYAGIFVARKLNGPN